MKVVEVDVLSQHYIGPMVIEPNCSKHKLFYTYINGEILGRIETFQKNGATVFYSQQITDKDLLNQIGEWIEFHYQLKEEL